MDWQSERFWIDATVTCPFGLPRPFLPERPQLPRWTGCSFGRSWGCVCLVPSGGVKFRTARVEGPPLFWLSLQCGTAQRILFLCGAGDPPGWASVRRRRLAVSSGPLGEALPLFSPALRRPALFLSPQASGAADRGQWRALHL